MMKQSIYRDLMNPIRSFHNRSIDSGRPLSALPDYRLDKFDLIGNRSLASHGMSPNRKKYE